MHSVRILLLDGFSTSSAMGAMELFTVANRIAQRVSGSDTALFDVQLISEQGLAVACSSGPSFPVDAAFDTIKDGDIVFLPGLIVATRTEVDAMLKANHEFLQSLNHKAATFSTLATHCSGTFLLAEAGIFNAETKEPVTTAWFLSKIFAERYPDIPLDKEAICSENGRLLCGGATTSYQDVVLKIIDRCAGRHFSRLVAKYMMIDNQRKSQAPYAILSDYDIDDPIVANAEQWVRKHLREDFKVEDIADHVAVSPRTLIRRFQKSIGESPQSLTQKLRIEKSKMLLETSKLPLAEIIERCGYSDESAFRRLFKRHCELSPRDYRLRFNAAYQLAEEA